MRKKYFKFRSLSVCNILLDIDTNDLHFSRVVARVSQIFKHLLHCISKKSKSCLTRRRTHDEETEEIFQNNIYEFFHQLIFNDIGEEH